jgi:hypothetical protein
MLRFRADQMDRLDEGAEIAFRAQLEAHCRDVLGDAAPADLAARLPDALARGRAAGLRHANSLALYATLAMALRSDPLDGAAASDGAFALFMRDPAFLERLDGRLAAARRNGTGAP